VQVFFSLFPNQGRCKVLICAFPAILNPIVDPLIFLADTRLQIGGVWPCQITRPELIPATIDFLQEIDSRGREMLLRMTQWIPGERLNSLTIEETALHRNSRFFRYPDGIVTDLKTLDKEYPNVVQPEKAFALKAQLGGSLRRAVHLETVFSQARWERIDKDWTKFSLWDFLVVILSETVAASSLVQAKKLVEVILDYELGRLTKQSYNSSILNLAGESSRLNKLGVQLRKWTDSWQGQGLLSAYCDLATNFSRRSWKTVLRRHNVQAIDLYVLLVRQNLREATNTTAFAENYDYLKDIDNYPSDKVAPAKPFHPPTIGIDELVKKIVTHA
jgi:hypothetical protein